MNDNRPDPDKLLEMVNNDRAVSSRGHLKIFFGASAGVGKTFAMLSEARRLLNKGTDVIIGVVEHHGRKETLELIDGIPILPLSESNHRGITVKEFDIDSALRRNPSLILIDEYAHTNSPGSRHPKRWQDVEELIENGIDVYTTLNVQHLESVNDVVAKFTGIWVNETVPDKAFDAADEISLVDIPSDELLKRLEEGKVYIAEGANKRAAENFFKKSNLIALRELALRRTAESVDAQSDELNAALGKNENQLSQKYLALVGSDYASIQVVRRTKRMSNSSKAQWYALNIKTDKDSSISEKATLRIEQTLRLAEKLGAKIIRLSGTNPAQEIINYAEKNGFSRIVVGHKKRSWTSFFTNSLASELISLTNGIEINVISEALRQNTDIDGHNSKKANVRWKDYLFSILIILSCVAFCMPLRDKANSNSLTMVFLFGIVLIASRYGIGPSLLSSLISVAAFNYFFTMPYYTFNFYDQTYYFTFAVMLVTSLLVGSMTARLSRLANVSRKDEAEAQTLLGLTKGLSRMRGIQNMAEFSKTHLEDALNYDIILIKKEDGKAVQLCGSNFSNNVKEMSAIDWVLKNNQIAGRNTNTLPSSKALYLPLETQGEVIGVLGIIPKAENHEFGSSEIQLFETFASLISGSFGRAIKADEAAQSKVDSENEKLRNILLSSLSHDLRTPLTIMNGMVSLILKHRKQMPREAVNETINLHLELERLQRFVSDLLKMASLTSGTIKLNLEEYSIEEIVGIAVKRLPEKQINRRVLIGSAGITPPIKVDGGLIEQVVVNLIENAIKVTDEESTISIKIEKTSDSVRVSVEDSGTGIDKGAENIIFDKFQSKFEDKYDKFAGSVGLGLAICKAIVETHGGRIYAKNNENKKGATFTFELPFISEAA